MGQPVVHFEIGCRDRDKSKAFYSSLFGWEINDSGPAAMINTGGKEGINGHISSLGHEPHNFITFYVQVEDLQQALDQAAQLGGQTIIPPTEIPGGMGRFAWLADPEGTLVGLWTPAAL
jgi:uncharacterized protein